MKPITSLAEKSNPNTVYTNSSKSKTNSSKPNTEVFILKKKKNISNTQAKTKPQQTKPSNTRSCRRSSLVVTRPSSQIADRSASAPMLGAPSGPPSRYFSLFLSDSLSVSLSLSH